MENGFRYCTRFSDGCCCFWPLTHVASGDIHIVLLAAEPLIAYQATVKVSAGRTWSQVTFGDRECAAAGPEAAAADELT